MLTAMINIADILFIPLFSLGADPSLSPDWVLDFHAGGGGIWRGRIPIAFENRSKVDARGAPAMLPVGKADGALDIEGIRAEEVRLAGPGGEDFLFRIEDAHGRTIRKGPVPAGSLFVLPVECPAGGKVTCHLYRDNPSAWPVPDFLESRPGVRNGGVEEGSGDTPDDWRHDASDWGQKASWSTQSPRSGERCLRTSVMPGNEPTWISTRQSGIHVTGGAEYLMIAWVRAEGVKGMCGWYIHVGDEKTPMMIAPMLSAGEGTFGWKRVEARFTAPAGATTASLGTVLRGTGGAWFDDVSLETDGGPLLEVRAGKAERLDLDEAGGDAPWPEGGEAASADLRLPVRTVNLSRDAVAGRLLGADIAPLASRLRGEVDPGSLRLLLGGAERPFARIGDRVIFEADLPPRSIRTLHLYGRQGSESAVGTPPSYTPLLASARNLVKNGSFEEGDGLPSGWIGGAPGEHAPEVRMGSGGPGLFGSRSARIEIPHGSKLAWTGWRQDVPVRPGRTYLLAAWLRSADLREGSAQVHVHFRDERGGLSKVLGMTGAGPAIGGTTGWTLLQGAFTCPPDATVLQIHLTMLATGTLEHDGVFLADVEASRTGEIESRPAKLDHLVAWPVSPVVKVFQGDPPPREVAPARISAARGEAEALQVAFRSPAAVPGLRIDVAPPVGGPGGAPLPDVEVGIVGLVPVDHPSSYYETAVPAWRRRVPSGPARSDGWPGLWPDPIVPRPTLDLPAGVTRSAWISVKVRRDAAPGEYASTVKISAAGKTLAEVPLGVTVRRFALPPATSFKAIYDLRIDGRWIPPGKDAASARRGFEKFLAERRLSPDRIEPEPVFRREGGRTVADFGAYDAAAAHLFDDLRVPHSYAPWWFYLFGWGHPPDARFGEPPYEGAYPYEGADRSKLRPAFRAAYQDCLRTWWGHVKEKGWEKRFVLYISDEPYFTQPRIRQQMKALCAMIHEVDPAIPIYSSTWSHVPEWDGSIDVWGLGHYGVVPVETFEKIRRSGGRFWFTTDGQMCLDTPLCAVERLLPHYAAKYGAEAYEFWGVSWLTYDPWEYGWHSFIHQSGEPGSTTWVRYPNGDGYLAYPGGPAGVEGPVTSVRLEAARDGVEDLEYLRILEGLIARERAAGRSPAAAERAIEEARALVEIPNAGGCLSTRILPDPGRLARARDAVAEAIEVLSARKRRVLYNLDGDSCLSTKAGNKGPVEVGVEDLRRLVAEIAYEGSRVDTLLVCIDAQVMYYPTRIGTMRGALSTEEERARWPDSERRRFQNVKAFFDAGIDPYAVILEEGRKKGLEVLLTFRMNDAHGNDFLRTKFWRDHPQYRLGAALDFGHEAVRDHVISLIREAIERYDADGIELDFQRFPTFFGGGSTEERVAKMASLVARVRTIVDDVGERRGRRLVLGARAPSDYGRRPPSPEIAREIGCDPAAWASKGLIDYLAVSEFLYERGDLPIAAWKAAVRGIPVYGGIECTEGDGKERYLTPEKYRRAAERLIKEGAGGIYLFNFFTTREYGADAWEPPFEVLRDLGGV
jgi:hypothetical protein